MKIAIVLPTYNERDNIVPLLHALQKEFLEIPHDMHILVVDDNSPDGTGALVKKEQDEFLNIHLISGQKAGLGSAYIRGMTYALVELEVEAVLEMDADFSHKPADVRLLIDALDENTDFVIGSRYVPGGSIPHEWGWLRRMISLWGNIVARYLVGMYRIRDCTAGFRAIRGSLLQQINLKSLRVQGYSFQVVLLHQALVKGARVKEIPVDFIDREYGKSKLGLSDILEFVMNAWWIRLESSKTFIKFILVGATGVTVNLLFFTVFLMWGMNKYLASPIAIELSIVWNFFLNNFWTFRKRNMRDRTRIRGLKFNAVSLIALGVSYTTFIFLSVEFPEVKPQIHQLIGIIPASIVNYFFNSYWTFRERKGQLS